jgi:hypothetical protein
MLLNLALIREPYNWLTVFLMCAFGLLALHIISPQPPQPKDTES